MELLHGKGELYSSLIHHHDRQSLWDYVKTEIQNNRSFRTTYRIYNKAGYEIWIMHHGYGIYSNKGQPIAVMGFVTDITNLKYSEIENKIANKINNLFLAIDLCLK